MKSDSQFVFFSVLIGIVLVKLAASCACATVQCDTPSTVEKEILINETGWSKSHLRDQQISES